MSKPRLYQLEYIKVNGKTIRIISRVASEWERVATRLHFEGHDIARIRRDNHLRTSEACRTMFNEWLEGKGRKPTSWGTVIQVLEEAEFSEIAGDLMDACALIDTLT